MMSIEVRPSLVGTGTAVSSSFGQSLHLSFFLSFMVFFSPKKLKVMLFFCTKLFMSGKKQDCTAVAQCMEDVKS